jgi:hypothetical protein
VVPAARPASAREYETALDPEPSAVPPAAGARVPNASLQLPGFTVLYRNQPVAEVMFGFAEALMFAVVPVIPVAARVVTVGTADVENDSTEPKLLPTEFSAMAQ